MYRQLKEVRKSRKLSQKEVAEKIGITTSYLCQIETGKRTFSVIILEKYLMVLDYSMVLLDNKQTIGKFLENLK